MCACVHVNITLNTITIYSLINSICTNKNFHAVVLTTLACCEVHLYKVEKICKHDGSFFCPLHIV